MPGRLYPAMRERPPEVRLNPASPLYGGLVFAAVGGHVRSAQLQDYTTFGRRGTLTNMTPASDWRWIPQLQRWALNFNQSSSQYVWTSDFAWPANAGPITVAFWNNAPTPSHYAAAFGIGQSGDSSQWIQAHAPWMDNILYWDYGGAYSGRLSTSYASYLNTWTHVGLTAAGASGNWQAIYLNGVVANSRTSSIAPSIENNGLWIGAARLIGTAWGYHQGLISDFCIWNRILTASEFAALADPTNVDYRIGGVPLILPPRRRLWPVSFAETPTGKVPWHLLVQVAN